MFIYFIYNQSFIERYSQFDQSICEWRSINVIHLTEPTPPPIERRASQPYAGEYTRNLNSDRHHQAPDVIH